MTWKWALLPAVVTALFAQQAKDGDFFIVSSVDLGKKQILLKRPTEVTELMRVDGDTRYFDEHGKAMKLTELRAGDTVYLTSKRSGEQPIAVTISKGPMTPDVLHERYLKSGK
jgi:hypothetical protein